MAKPKLSPEQVETIRQRLSASPDEKGLVKKLADEYGVDHSAISRIKNGKAFSDGAPAQAGAAAPLSDIPHNLIEPSPLNPRKRFDEDKIIELSDSIHEEGVLQNLVVRPHPTKPGRYEIASGERRWRGVEVNIKRGLALPDYPMPVRIKDLTDRELIRLAMAENMARADMTPLEEADTFQKLLELGDTTTQIAQTAGKSKRFVELRLKLLTGLCPEVRQALADNKIKVEMARVLSMATLKDQKQHLRNILDERWGRVTAEDLRETIQSDMAVIDKALFDIDASGIEYIVDEDTGEKLTNDHAKYRELQTKAIDAKVEELKAGRTFVDLCGTGQKKGGYDSSAYRKSGKAKAFGCVVQIEDDLSIEIRDGLLRNEVKAQSNQHPAKGTVEKGKAAKPTKAEQPPKPLTDALTRPHLEHALRRKTDVLQAAVADSALMAMRLVCLALLGGKTCVRIRNAERKPCDATPVAGLQERIKKFAPALGLKKITVDGHGSHAGSYSTTDKDELQIWIGLCGMDHGQIETLFAALVATRIGTYAPYGNAGLGDAPIAVAIAASLEITAQHVGFDKQDLEGLRRPALDAIVRSMGEGHETKGMTGTKLREFLPSALAGDYVVPTLKFGTKGQIAADWDGRPIPDADQPEENYDEGEDESGEGEEDDGSDEPTFGDDEIEEAAQ